jgi:Nickel responsive protein SCO4226-like
VAEFLVETYVARADGAAVERGAERARDAAERLTREGTPVHFLRSVFVPEDETCFYLYQAASSDAVHAAAHRAALPFERVVETVAEPQREEQP